MAENTRAFIWIIYKIFRGAETNGIAGKIDDFLYNLRFTVQGLKDSGPLALEKAYKKGDFL